MINKKNKAFTLYELLISMGLLLLVSTVVITFISSISMINKKNKKYTEFVSTMVEFRKETDFWFSTFDNLENELVIDNNQFDYLIYENKHSDNQFNYGIKLVEDKRPTDNIYLKTAIFYYPNNSFHETREILLNGIKSVWFIEKKNEHLIPDLSSEKTWSFSVSTHVRENVYRCIIVHI